MVGAALAGVSVLSLCEKGDAFIMAETGKVFKKEKEMKKGKSCMLCSSLKTKTKTKLILYMKPPHFVITIALLIIVIENIGIFMA